MRGDKTMNKYTKIGLSALCGSLASISVANAGTLEVLGTAEATWTNLSGGETGNPIGMNTGLTFKGSGELDGGQTFSVSLVDTDKAAWSSSNITLNTNSVGTFILSSAEGGQGIGGYDDNMPRAWEEVWDTGIATNANFQKGVGSSTNISWTSPKVAGTTLQLAYAPDNDGVQNANKAVSGDASHTFGRGFDVVLDINPQFDAGGFNLFVGGSVTDQSDQIKSNEGLKDLGGDHEEGVAGLEITIGPLQLGGQASVERIRTQTANTNNYYGNSSWGVAFNVNDNLSISYSEARHVASKTKKQGYVSQSIQGADTVAPRIGANANEYTPKSWMKGDSIQVAYTIGGIGLKYSETQYDNTGYGGFDTAKAPKESRIFAVSLAF
jgi:hypothetical protein